MSEEQIVSDELFDISIPDDPVEKIRLSESCKKNIDSKNITGIFAEAGTCYLYKINRKVIL